MTFDEYQTNAQRTSPAGHDRARLSIVEFTERLKKDGYYIGDDSHIHRPNGQLTSRKCRNGYYMTQRMIDTVTYRFMEHRVIWVWVNGDIRDDLVINHLNCDREDNRIENLELVTPKENVEYTKKLGRLNTAKGENNGKSSLTNKEAQLIRHLRKNGYLQREIAELFDIPNVNTVSRVVTGARYGSVPDASDVMAIYPLFVELMCKKGMSTEQRLLEGALGLCGETGEVVDLIKKWMFQGHELDVNSTIDELGDALFYLCMICNALEIDLSEIYYNNIAKLCARYPDGFDADRSINRKDDK